MNPRSTPIGINRQADPADEYAKPSAGRTRVTGLHILWIVVSVMAIMPFVLAPFPPLLDYYQWMFEAHIVAILTGVVEPRGDVPVWYSLKWVTIPNTMSDIVMGAIMSRWLQPEQAARLFYALSGLTFAFGFAYLMRSVQRRATAVELLGFPWAYGYFMYAGFANYLLSVAIAMVSIGKIHRIFLRSERSVLFSDLMLLTLLGTLLYLSHLFGWLVYFLAISLYSIALIRIGRRAASIQVFATLTPSFMMLLWYVVERQSGAGVGYELYQSFPNKMVSLVGPLLLVLRIDPFSPLFPVFWSNVFFLALIAGTVIWQLEGSLKKSARQPLFFAGVLLTSCALIIPFSYFGGLVRPDERFTLPALLVTLTTLRFKRYTNWRGICTTAVVLLVLGLHVAEYYHGSQALTRVHTTIMTHIPHGAPALSLSVHRPPLYGSCDPRISGPSLGAPTLQWFGLYRQIETRELRATLFGTGLVSSHVTPEMADLVVAEMTPDQVRAEVELGSRLATKYRFVEVFGCRDNVKAVGEALAPEFVMVVEGEGFAILRRSG